MSPQLLQGELFPDESDDQGTAHADEVPQQLVAAAPPAPARPPYLRRLTLRRFKRFEDFTVELGPFNVIAGPNNAGKSTLLQAIDLFYSLLKVLRDGERVTARSRYMPSTILPVAAGQDIFHGQVQRQGNVPVEATISAEFITGESLTVGLRYLFGASNCRIVDGDATLDTYHALLAWPAVWVPSSVGVVRDEEYRTPARRAGLISAGRNNEVLRNVLLDLRRTKPERFARLQDVLSLRFAADVRDVAFEELTDQFVSARYRSDRGITHDLYSAGAGFIQVLQLLTFVFSRDISVVLLDEPDAHLHSSMQRVVVEVLEELAKSDNLQVLLSTHSKEIINFVDPSRLIVLEPDVRVAGPAGDSVVTITALRAVGDVDNVDAFELVRKRRCLFVEGREEKTVLGRFAATLGSTAFTGEGRVVAVAVGGADRFEQVQQLTVIESFLGGRIDSLELRDRDGLLDDRRRQIMETSRRSLHIWDRDCLESYLIDPTVLARVINDVTAERGHDVHVADDEILAMLLDCTERLRDETIDRISAKYLDVLWLMDRERAAVQEANGAARDALGREWTDLEARLRFVSGKRLLGMARQLIQERYGASFGNERLAEAFSRDEIAREIVDAIAAVERMGR